MKLSILNSYIFEAGEAPLPENMHPKIENIDDMLLYSAWAHGLFVPEAGEYTVHRLSLFAYIQSHIANIPQESLEETIQTSPFWQRVDNEKGVYELNGAGILEAVDKFGSYPLKVDFGLKYKFSKMYREKRISVIVDLLKKQLKPEIDGTYMSGPSACNVLENLGVSTFKRKLPARVLNWIIKDNKYTWERTDSAVSLSVQDDGVAVEDDEQSFPEGKDVYRVHCTRERNQKVVNLAKKRQIERDTLLSCQICNFSFKRKYGELGIGFIEAHHIIPLSHLEAQTETKIEDIILVCSNCHRMLHRRRPWLSVNELKELLIQE